MYIQPNSSLRQGQGPSFCKSEGRGRHEVSLEVGAGQCGWKREGQKVRLDLYVQYDAHVQQVIDDQISVECDMANREGRIVTQFYGEEVINIPVQSVQSYGVGHSWVSVEEEEFLDGIENNVLDDIEDEEENELVKRGRMEEESLYI